MFLIINILHFNKFSNFVHIMGTEIWNRIIRKEKKNIYIYIWKYKKHKCELKYSFGKKKTT